jgi:hypothetical protein
LKSIAIRSIAASSAHPAGSGYIGAWQRAEFLPRRRADA